MSRADQERQKMFSQEGLGLGIGAKLCALDLRDTLKERMKVYLKT